VLDKFGWLSAEFVNRDYIDSGRDETDVSEPETILEEASAKLGRCDRFVLLKKESPE